METELDESLFQTLADNAGRWNTPGDWPSESLMRCGDAGVFHGLCGVARGEGVTAAWSASERIATLMRLAEADLLTTFVITQHLGAIKRMLAADRNEFDGQNRAKLLADLLSGRRIASVGISHLTTSRQHLARPAVSAVAEGDGYRVEGTIPWVTGAGQADPIVVGATCEDQSEILFVLPTDQPGVRCGPGAEMVALSASCTDAVHLDGVYVSSQQVMSGPRMDVLIAPGPKQKRSTGAGGLQTSALAIGLSSAALAYLVQESGRRPELTRIVDRFRVEHAALRTRLLDAVAAEASSDDNADDPGEIRAAANSLVQRTTNAAMTTAKGAGLMSGHPVGRWCRQALFFLVWSCPQSVSETHLCELAGIE